MTYHSSFGWSKEDPVTPELVAEVVNGLKCNHEYEGNRYTPIVYMPFNDVDRLIIQSGQFLDDHSGVSITEEMIHNTICCREPYEGEVLRGVILQLKTEQRAELEVVNEGPG